MSSERIRVRVLYAGRGGYHSETISVPGSGTEEYDRLIDFIREDPAVAAECYIDAARLCSAQVVEGEGQEG
ncbi:MAG: hypothetical protein OXL34_08740 [Gemmatimonadota bacterium]|nr:hypothetical protein [Gemmatimonadota bacterium]